MLSRAAAFAAPPPPGLLAGVALQTLDVADAHHRRRRFYDAAAGQLLLDLEPAPPATMREICGVVARAHGVTRDDLIGPCRANRFSIPRQEAMYLMRGQFRPDGSHRFTTTQIGRYLGGRDHTTVLWGVRRHRARMAAAAFDQEAAHAV